MAPYHDVLNAMDHAEQHRQVLGTGPQGIPSPGTLRICMRIHIPEEMKPFDKAAFA